ncbi:hypothetical protein MLD38_015965 [Melastoma candidum]|uniref:Uncharacterized protein n=1 Tax=Melastoma candidum TaxID=119954 RepID=A0ACB9RI08_9MYRT|nr:hypothetical protein MLD38_015965 [Melastoma candidum]
MPAGHGLRSRTRDLFSRPFRKKGYIPLSTYLRTYKIGDYVDVKVNGAIHKGMPHKFYHGRTGSVWNVTKRAIGVEINKQVGNRIIRKRIHVRVEHVQPSRCNEDFQLRKKKNDQLKAEAKAIGKVISTKRQPEGPKPGFMVEGLCFIIALLFLLFYDMMRLGFSGEPWKKFCAELNVEINLLFGNWQYILGGIVFQYIHGLAARGVRYLHRPGPVLPDLCFFLIPELGPQNAYISESTFGVIFFSFFLWTFHPFVYQNKKIYTVLLWCRVLAYLVASQILRILTFYATQLPGQMITATRAQSFPGYHHHELFPRGVFYGCGDLIFSSDMIFTLVFVSTYHQYGTKRFIKQCGWLLAVIQSVLIIASHKHYTVDIVVAWYTVNLVIFFINKKFPELRDRSVSSQQLLPVISKDKEVKSKEDQYNSVNGIATTNGVHR